MEALWIFLPVIGAPLLHAPVLRYDLLRALKRPLDGGRTLRGRRIFGDNKTWRGALLMVGGVLLATLLLSLWPWWWGRLPQDIRSAGPVPYGLLVGLGVVAGELPNSFLKRRIGIAPGSQRRSAAGRALMVLDQGDLVLRPASDRRIAASGIGLTKPGAAAVLQAGSTRPPARRSGS